jgi:hypothetical protein
MPVKAETLLSRMLLGAILEHPLPWRVEQDWTNEVTDADGNIVVKCQTAEEAQAIIDLAMQQDDELIKMETAMSERTLGPFFDQFELALGDDRED